MFFRNRGLECGQAELAQMRQEFETAKEEARPGGHESPMSSGIRSTACQAGTSWNSIATALATELCSYAAILEASEP